MESIKDAGAERYRFIAMLDSKTSPKCRELDGKSFKVEDAAVGANMPPMHVKCRSTTAIAYGEQLGKRIARDADGKIIRVSADMTYTDWKTVYIDKKQTLEAWEKSKQPAQKNDKIEYKEAKTIKEANIYAKNTLGIKHAEYKGLHLQVANEWNKGLADSFQRFPELRQRIGFTGECHEQNNAVKPVVKKILMEDLIKKNPKIGIDILEPYAEQELRRYMQSLRVPSKAYAASWSPSTKELRAFSGITFNRVNGKDIDKLLKTLKADVQSTYHPVGCESIRSVLDHEIGHQLDSMLKLSENKAIKNLRDSITKDELTEKLSKYAWKNNNANKYGEFIAEAWAEYCNNSEPRAVAKEVGKVIEEAYVAWKKKNL